MAKRFKAQEAIEGLHRIAASVPGYEAADSKIWRTIIRKASYPDEYLEAGAAALQASAELRDASRVRPEAVRESVGLSMEIRAVIHETEALLQGLKFTDARIRAEAADLCNDVYALAPAIARADGSLRPHVEAMHRTSRRKGYRKK